MPESDVSIGVRWAESGADVPARTASNLRMLEPCFQLVENRPQPEASKRVKPLGATLRHC